MMNCILVRIGFMGNSLVVERKLKSTYESKIVSFCVSFIHSLLK